MYNFWSHGDSRESIEFILNKYYEKENRPQVFAVGASMGSNLLLNMLGFDGQKKKTDPNHKNLVDGAFALSTPMKLSTCYPNLQNALYGFYHK